MKSKYEYSVSSLLATASTITLAAAPMTAAVGGRMYRIPVAQRVCVADDQESREEAEALAELRRITPPNAELLALADRFPAPQEWYDE